MNFIYQISASETGIVRSLTAYSALTCLLCFIFIAFFLLIPVAWTAWTASRNNKAFQFSPDSWGYIAAKTFFWFSVATLYTLALCSFFSGSTFPLVMCFPVVTAVYSYYLWRMAPVELMVFSYYIHNLFPLFFFLCCFYTVSETLIASQFVLAQAVEYSHIIETSKWHIEKDAGLPIFENKVVPNAE